MSAASCAKRTPVVLVDVAAGAARHVFLVQLHLPHKELPSTIVFFQRLLTWENSHRWHISIIRPQSSLYAGNRKALGCGAYAGCTGCMAHCFKLLLPFIAYQPPSQINPLLQWCLVIEDTQGKPRADQQFLGRQLNHCKACFDLGNGHGVTLIYFRSSISALNLS